MRDPKVEAAVDAVYLAFASERRPASIDTCPCCFNDGDVCALLEKQLRELTGDELSSYAESVFLTAGGPKDFHYFLPRILDLVVHPSGVATIAVEIALGKLTRAAWTTWPANEREAVLRLFDAVMRADVDDSPLDRWLCGIALAGCDPLPHLERLLEPGRESALLHIYEENSIPLQRKQLSSSFWSDVPEARDKVVAWFLSSRIEAKITQAYGL